MRAIVQRVSSASVRVDGRVVGSCQVGYVVLVAALRSDTTVNAEKMADRVRGLRVFNDEAGKMNLALADVGGSVLAISNFTVAGDATKNRRPSFIDAASFEDGKLLFDAFVEALRGMGVGVETGLFGAHMDVELVSDGPVTVIVEA